MQVLTGASLASLWSQTYSVRHCKINIANWIYCIVRIRLLSSKLQLSAGCHLISLLQVKACEVNYSFHILYFFPHRFEIRISIPLSCLYGKSTPPLFHVFALFWISREPTEAGLPRCQHPEPPRLVSQRLLRNLLYGRRHRDFVHFHFFSLSLWSAKG